MRVCMEDVSEDMCGGCVVMCEGVCGGWGC